MTVAHTAELRARRAASVMLGVAVLVYVGATLASFGQSPGVVTHWWWIVTLSGRLVFGVALVVVPWFAGQGVLRVLALSFALFGFVTTAASFVAVLGGMSELLRDQALYAWAAALALRPVRAWVLIVVTELLAVATRLLRVTDPVLLIESSLVSFTTTVLLVILLLAVLQMARARDLGEQAVLRAISQDVEHAAVTAERARIERVVHDDVLGTLRAASLGLATARVDPASMAAVALDRLADLVRSPGDAEAAVGAEVLGGRLRALTAALAPATEVRVSVSGDVVIPAEVAVAITEACAEALRNSVLHAPPGREVSRILRLSVTEDAVEVTVEDDGDGFDTAGVPPHRLGVARSIVGRMRAVPGGDAVVGSVVGSGTTVSVSWRG